ncbi:MAG TPA: tetratricopeptide repeat protein [Pseudobdellovibrionaceae bacterium]|nr:tetratricopeptide repeat protein [Pseudobdellovibrionaceae bacterium]
MRKILFVLLLLPLAGCGESLTWTAFRKNREAADAIKKDSPDLAVLALTEGLASSPFQPELHVNLGIAFERQKKAEDAIKSLKNAETVAKDDWNRFVARYNLGVLYGSGKKVDDALAWYQKALEILPGSVEAKTNIEFLMRAQQGGGEGERQEKQEGGEGQTDQKDSKGDQKDDPQKDPKDGKDQKEDKPKEYGQPPPQYKPREFKGELHEADVKKILGEIKQQEQRIRAEYNRRDVKERPRDKDW